MDVRLFSEIVAFAECEPGAEGVSAPIRDFKQRIVAVFNISAPKQRFGRHLEQAGALTAAVAKDFSATLGADEVKS